jgi:hypothetical protein
MGANIFRAARFRNRTATLAWFEAPQWPNRITSNSDIVEDFLYRLFGRFWVSLRVPNRIGLKSYNVVS